MTPTTYRLVTGVCPGTGDESRCKNGINSMVGIGHPESSIVRCRECLASHNVEQLRGDGHTIIEMELNTIRSAIIQPHYNALPHHDLVRRVLHKAVLQHYGLSDPNGAVSGVIGRVYGKLAYLTSLSGCGYLGMERVQIDEPNAADEAVLQFYAAMLRELYFNPLTVGGVRCHAATLLELGDSERDTLKAVAILNVAIARASNDPELPRFVFTRLSQRHPDYAATWQQVQRTDLARLMSTA